uniref:Mitochondrial dicarboxylate carrier n=1 Tax=Ditylenchus dipsaci TaxID=166011 RepID=A0A915D056_9BILA
MAVRIWTTDGLFGFYNGLSASLMRQLTYSATRFGVYETVKAQFPADKPMAFYQKVFLAGFSGACGGVVGSPADLINVRMQNDIKLPAAERRHYKHAIDGVFRICREEGIAKLFNGCTMATIRGTLMTIGQLSFYDQIKETLITSGYANDDIYTHLGASFLAASCATVLTQPMDGILDCCVYTAKLGPVGFYKADKNAPGRSTEGAKAESMSFYTIS